MKLLITGIAGFLGGHVAEYFIKKGWEVIGIDNLATYELKRANYDIEKSRAHNLQFLEKIGAKFIEADCRYIKEPIFEDINLIIHCAAQPAMTISIEDPSYDASNNIMGTINILEMAKKFNIPLITCSSIHVYGNSENSILDETETRFVRDPPEINENHPILQGEITPLHISKYAVELYTMFFVNMYKLKAASFRITGMYGERQFGGMDHGWVANFAIRTIMERGITIFGSDKQVRDILYAEDVARAFYLWYQVGCPSGIFNLGGGMDNSISLKECLFKLRNITGKEQTIKFENKREGDLWYFVCDYKKLNETIGWKPEITIDEGLKKICYWVLKNRGLFE